MTNMKQLVLLFSMVLCSYFAQAQNEVQATTNKQHPNLRADEISILLVKQIEGLADSAHHTHHHDPHKSSYQIVHIKFQLITNDPSIKGNKTVIMRLIDPHGADIFDPVSGGGLFMLNNKETPYTYKYSGMYTGQPMAVDFLYKHSKHFKHGTHIVEFYVDGFKVGEEHFVIQ